MRVGKSSRDFSSQRDLSDGRKLALIKFIDDNLGENSVEIRSDGNKVLEMFEIKSTIDKNVFELWLKAGLTLIPGEFTVNIVPNVTGEGTPPAQQTFTLNIKSTPLSNNNANEPLQDIDDDPLDDMNNNIEPL